MYIAGFASIIFSMTCMSFTLASCVILIYCSSNSSSISSPLKVYTLFNQSSTSFIMYSVFASSSFLRLITSNWSSQNQFILTGNSLIEAFTTLTLNFLPYTWNFNLFSLNIRLALYFASQFEPIKNSSLFESTIWMLIDTCTSNILRLAFSMIPTAGLFWLFMVTICRSSFDFFHFRLSLTANSLMQTDICVSISHKTYS